MSNYSFEAYIYLLWICIDEGLTSITPGTDHVYESIEEEDAVSPVHSEHMYENQTPSGRPLPINGQESANGFIGEFTVSSRMPFVICHKTYFANINLMWLGLNKLVNCLQDSFQS